MPVTHANTTERFMLVFWGGIKIMVNYLLIHCILLNSYYPILLLVLQVYLFCKQ